MLKKILDKYKELPISVKATIWFFICTFLQKSLTFITTPIFTRLLTTEEYGKFSVFTSWLSIATAVISMNMYSGMYVQGLVKFDKKREEYAAANQGLCFTLTVIWTFIYLLFKDFFNATFSLNTVQMLAMILIVWTSSVYSFWSVEQRVDLKYRKFVILTIAVSIIKPAIGIFLVIFSDDKVTARIVGIAIVEFIAYFWIFIYEIRKGKKFFSYKIWKYVLSVCIPLIPHYLSLSALTGADRIMIENMVGESEAGIYSLSYSVSMIMSVVNTALLQTVEPWLYKKIKAREAKAISGIAYSLFIMVAVVNLVLIAFAPEVIAIFAPAEYYDAIYIIPPVAMSVFFMFMYSFYAVFEFYYEKTKLISVATVVGALLNIGLNYIFINIFGYYAAGYTTLACYILTAVFHYCVMRKICKKYLDNVQVYETKKILAISVVFMVAGFLLLSTYASMLVRYIIIVLLLILMLIKRKRIIELIKKIVAIKKM